MSDVSDAGRAGDGGSAAGAGETTGPTESTVIVNGEPRALPATASLLDVLRSLESDRQGVAVAVNDQVVPRAGWSARRLEPGDRIEVVRAVAGG